MNRIRTSGGGVALLLAAAMMSSPQALSGQRLLLPAGKLDSAALQNPLQMIDFVFVDDRPKAAALFAELLTRERDIDPAMAVQIRYLRAVAASEQDVVIAEYRELARTRGNEFRYALPRVLLATGEYTEAIRVARQWQPAPGAPGRPLREEIEATVARLRGEHPRALALARAMRQFPGQARNQAALALELASLAHITKAEGGESVPRQTLRALLDSALATPPRGFRIDPVLVFSGYGDALKDAGHHDLAAIAWQRALALLDSTASRAADRGPLVQDSIRVSRGRLLYALGRYADARPLLQTPSGRRDLREQYRKGWLAITAMHLGDTATARQLEAQLAADTAHALRGATAMARASIAEALGDPRRGASYILAQRNAIDVRTLQSQWQLRRTLQDSKLLAWMRGR